MKYIYTVDEKDVHTIDVYRRVWARVATRLGFRDVAHAASVGARLLKEEMAQDVAQKTPPPSGD